MPKETVLTSPLATYEIATGSTINEGDLVCVNSSGKAVPAADTASLKIVGVAFIVADRKVEVQDGVFALTNDTTNALSRTDRGAPAYVKGATTVDKTGGTNKIAVGIVIDVYDSEVYVDCRPAAVAAAKALTA